MRVFLGTALALWLGMSMALACDQVSQMATGYGNEIGSGPGAWIWFRCKDGTTYGNGAWSGGVSWDAIQNMNTNLNSAFLKQCTVSVIGAANTWTLTGIYCQ